MYNQNCKYCGIINFTNNDQKDVNDDFNYDKYNKLDNKHIFHTNILKLDSLPIFIGDEYIVVRFNNCNYALHVITKQHTNNLNTILKAMLEYCEICMNKGYEKPRTVIEICHNNKNHINCIIIFDTTLSDKIKFNDEFNCKGGYGKNIKKTKYYRVNRNVNKKLKHVDLNIDNTYDKLLKIKNGENIKFLSKWMLYRTFSIFFMFEKLNNEIDICNVFISRKRNKFDCCY